MIEDLLNCENSQERAELKAASVANLDVVGTFEHEESGLVIEIKAINKIDGGVEVFARAWRDNKQLGFGKDGSVDIERFRIFNPPIMVPDGTTHIETDPTGKEVEVENFVEDHAGALRNTLAHTIGIVCKDSGIIKRGKIGNTTDTFYPDANPETTSVDGNAGYSGVQVSWATARGHAGNSSDDSSAAPFQPIIACGGLSANYTDLTRGFFLFDTSAITDTDTIDSATFSVYVVSKDNSMSASTAQAALALVASTPASNTAIANSDAQNIGTTRFATDLAYADATTSAYNTFTLNASGLAAITKTGVSKFGLRIAADLDNSEPTFSANNTLYYQLRMADQAGTTSDPKLVVVHSAAPVTKTVTDTATATTTANKSLSRTFANSVTTTAIKSVIRQVSKTVLDTITATSAMTRGVTKVLLNTLTSSTSVPKSLSRTFLNTTTITSNFFKTVSLLFLDTVSALSALNRITIRLNGVLQDLIWSRQSKNSSSWSNQSKNSSSWSNQTKNTTTWTNEDKS